MDKTALIKRGSSSLLILFVVFVFVLCSLFLILYGAHVYTSIRDRVDVDFTRRMGISYITNKLRACDVYGGVTADEGAALLRLCSEPGDPLPLYTYIYFYNGSIMEYITQEASGFDPEDGETIMAAGFFWFEPVPGGLRFRVGAGAEEITYTVSLRSA